ncbi:MAG TPA: glutamate--tRNA ligase, partial [Chthoniobacterales bacterium]|nr:glutamate--tRNA ligase [Chthoniobacterales bacterium]
AQAIYDGLRWLGLDWDEGPQAGGDLGPYFQSEREHIYVTYLDRLRAADRVYDDNGSVRFRFERENVLMDDVICGHVEIDMSNPETNPDMTIRRPDGSWIFHFVNVVDDIEMKISHVIRGEDHLSNTPKHIQLYKAFGAEPPRFAHIPLILNQDGSKMSKRDQGASLVTYMENGYLPEAVRNYLCLLGWSPKDNREKLDLGEVVQLFDLGKVHRKNAAFDLEKCTWLNGEYLRELSDDRFQELGREALKKAGVDLSRFSAAYVQSALETCKGKFRTFSELPAYGGFYFRDDFQYNPEGVAKHFVPENKPRLEQIRAAFAGLANFNAAELETTLKATAANLGVKAGVLVHPTRLAVTGSNAGPSLYHLLEILGKEKVLARLDRALAQI